MVSINNYRLIKNYNLVANEKIVLTVFNELDEQLSSLTLEIKSGKRGVFNLDFQEVDAEVVE